MKFMKLLSRVQVKRRTLLFSATMNTKVDELMKLIRMIKTQLQAQKALRVLKWQSRLKQEFFRVRSVSEGINRVATLLSLLTRTFLSRAIVCFSTKADAHRLMIVCGLCGIKFAELHGNLTQIQRLEVLSSFRVKV